MAKSKKALKALKRRKAVKGRSRVVKQRQDYTLGGRVKAAEGSQPQQLYARNEGEDYDDYQARVTASQAADPNFNRDAYQQAVKTGVGAAPIPGAATTFKSTQGNLVATGDQTIVTPTSDPVPTPDSVVTQPSESTQQPVVTQQPVPTSEPTQSEVAVSQQSSDSGTSLSEEELAPYRGRRYDDEKDFSEADYQAINKAGGDTNSDGRITDEEWTQWMLGKGPTEGFETAYAKKLQEVKEQGAISEQSIASIDQYLASVTKPDDPTKDDPRPAPGDESFPDSPFDYKGLEINDDTEIRQIGLNDGTNETFMANIPWGALTDLQRQDIENIYSNYPYPNQEKDRAVATYNYLNGQLGLKEIPIEDRPPEDQPEKPIYYRNEIPPVEEQESILKEYANKSYENLVRSPRRQDFPQTDSGTQQYQTASNTFKTTRNNWNTLNPQERLTYLQSFTPEELSKGVRATTGSVETIYPFVTIQEDPNIDSTVGDPADAVLKEIYDKNRRKNYRISDPETFETVTTPQLDTQLTDRTLDTISDTATRTTSAVDAATTTGTATDAVAQTDITASTMQAYNQAEANYFDKYPQARDAIANGDYENIFDYQAKVGEELGYDLNFDDTKIAESDFNTLATSSRAELTATNAALRNRQDEEAAKGTTPDFSESVRSQVDPVTGETFQLSVTPDAERLQRRAILDEEAATGTEAFISGSVGYEAAEKRQIKGTAANAAAVSLLQEVGELPTDIAEAILDNPATVTAQVDTAEVQVQAAIAAMPQEALVSAQLESLLAGIDEGTTPTWARPAVQSVEARLNARGLSVSTVGRDALFNAIIQTSIPIAQSNAAALQQRANQNLSNQQQANLQQSAQEMQLRLTNVANRQSAESQSATLAQQINLTQGQFTQAAQMTEAEQQQQVRLQSLQNEQQAAMANLGNDQQIELANLQVEADRLGANQSAVNQERIAEMQVSANFMQKNQEFVQQMELANLSNDQQMRLSFLTAKNQADSESLNVAQQTELANLNKRLEVNKVNAGLAQQMGVAQLNVDQQRAMQNASTVANIDLSKFSASQQVELANSKFMQTATLQDLNNRQQTVMQDATALASMDLQAADSLTKVSIENARNFLQKDLSNLSIEQQAFMLDSQQSQQRMLTATTAENAAKQFNSTSTNQTNQFMTSLGQQLNLQNEAQSSAMSQFNATEANRLAAINEGNTLDAAKFTSQLNTQIDQFNTQIDFQRDQWNKQNAQAVEQSNVNWRRQTNMAETAAQNAANQLQAQQLFQLDQSEQAFLWQQLRDEATYYRQQYESEQQRKTTLYATALANEAETGPANVSSIFSRIGSLFEGLATGSSGDSFRGPASDTNTRGLDLTTTAEEETRQAVT